MTGIFLDVTGRKQAEEGHELLAGEMSHRVKNLLALASGLTAITSRSTETKEEMARQLTDRLTALGRAHDLVRPLPRGQGSAALLGDLFAVLLAPYDDVGAFAGRIRVAVPRMGLGEKSATSLALVIHELATNSLKYGALTVDTGLLDVSGSTADGVVEIIWTEHGGPAVEPAEFSLGFGSKLVQRTVGGQLGGSIAYEWAQGGAHRQVKDAGRQSRFLAANTWLSDSERGACSMYEQGCAKCFLLFQRCTCYSFGSAMKLYLQDLIARYPWRLWRRPPGSSWRPRNH